MHPEIEGLFKSHSPMVFRVCLRYAKDREEAEDLTQDVFLRINGSLESFARNSKMATWIYRIAVNICLDHLRSKKRRGALLENHHNTLVFENLAPGEDRELAKIDLDRILGEIRPEVRQILFLTLAEGLSYEEAGEIVGKTGFAVSKTVSRFRRGLRSKPGLLAAGRSYFAKKEAS
jgi:RNA polymerase sigma-70 factor (ECF subfamily)